MDDKYYIQVGKVFIGKKNIAYIRIKSGFENPSTEESAVIYFVGHGVELSYHEFCDKDEVAAIKNYLEKYSEKVY